MTLTVEEICRLMEKFKELGLTSFEIESEGIKMGNQPAGSALSAPLVKVAPPIPDDIKPEDIENPMSVFDEPDEDELLYWSTPYYDDLQAKKQAIAAARESGTNETT